MTAEQLKQRIAEYEAAQKEAEAQFHRIAGALAILRELLARQEQETPKPD
jgi:hypothetical protein